MPMLILHAPYSPIDTPYSMPLLILPQKRVSALLPGHQLRHVLVLALGPPPALFPGGRQCGPAAVGAAYFP